MSILFNRRVSLQVDPFISTSARSSQSLFNVVCFIRPKLSLFSRPPTFFLQGLIYLNQVSILFMWIFSIPFFQCSYPVILMKILTKPQVHHSSFFFFSGGFNSSFLDHIFFSFQCFSYAGAPHNNALLAFHLFRSAEDISEGSSCLSRLVQPISRLLSHSSHLNLTGAFSLKSFNGVSFEWA